jgi:hypothetical protein
MKHANNKHIDLAVVPRIEDEQREPSVSVRNINVLSLNRVDILRRRIELLEKLQLQ